MRWAAFLVIGAIGCGGVVGQEPLTYFDDAGNPLDVGSSDTGVDAFRPDTSIDTGRDSVRDAALDTWFDPGCPDAPLPAKDFKCDPLKPAPGDCGKNQACFPYVDYPTDPCGHEVYHAACFPAGPGRQGDPCSEVTCAAGFICVATGAGNVCVSLCNPGKAGGCPEGLVCGPTDVPGVGGCL
jgi:hypothetical protein